jgi:hypothetical protein
MFYKTRKEYGPGKKPRASSKPLISKTRLRSRANRIRRVTLHFALCSTDFNSDHTLSVLESPLNLSNTLNIVVRMLVDFARELDGQALLCRHLAVAQRRYFVATNYHSGTAYKSMSGELLGGR